jgi:hypothetical protein
MILKYNDFYTLINIIKTISFKNTNFSNFFLVAYFNKTYKYNLLQKQKIASIKNNFLINKYVLSYLYKFYLLYIEIFLVKYSKKSYVSIYLFISFFNFFFKFLNWYYNFLLLNLNIFILDKKVLKILKYDINNCISNNMRFLFTIKRQNYKFFINLDNNMSKNYSRLLYGKDIYMLDLSMLNDFKYNTLYLLFLMRNLVIFTKFFNNI